MIWFDFSLLSGQRVTCWLHFRSVYRVIDSVSHHCSPCFVSISWPNGGVTRQWALFILCFLVFSFWNLAPSECLSDFLRLFQSQNIQSQMVVVWKCRNNCILGLMSPSISLFFAFCCICCWIWSGTRIRWHLWRRNAFSTNTVEWVRTRSIGSSKDADRGPPSPMSKSETFFFVELVQMWCTIC